MTSNQTAAKSLALRAMASDRQTEADLLIDTAKRLDPSINAEELRAQWLEKWLEANKNRSK